MKKSLFLPAIILLVIVAACNKSNDNLMPANNQKVLGIVLQVSSNSNKLILLKDGRTISPVSGFNPENLVAGNKFTLSFTPSENQWSSKIIAANVTSYSLANDSTFIPPVLGDDSVKVKDVLQGTHSSVFTYSQFNSSNPSDTSTLVDKYISMQFDGNTFSSLNPPALPMFIPGGEGIFFFTPGNQNLINFVNEREFPAEAPPGFILNGQWNIAIFDSFIMLWKNGSFTYNGTTTQEFSSFRITK